MPWRKLAGHALPFLPRSVATGTLRNTWGFTPCGENIPVFAAMLRSSDHKRKKARPCLVKKFLLQIYFFCY